MHSVLFQCATRGLAVLFALSGGAQAATIAVLHSFVGGSSDGATPLGGVAPAGRGDFYVATDGGGSSNRGTLTLIRKDGTAQVLHAFTGGLDGQNADGTPLVWSFDGNVYGTTQFGGSKGCGTFYNYLPGSGTYQQLYVFQCAPSGAFPYAGFYDAGNFLAVATANGGTKDDGQIFVVLQDGGVGGSCELNGTGGAHPYAGIIFASDNRFDDVFATVGNAGGTHNLGTITTFGDDCTPIVLHDFAGGNDGASPYGTLLLYKHVLYGTTASGGTGGNLGTVFKIYPDGGGYSVLHSFQGICCGSDGSFPRSGLAWNKSDGMLYGTTTNGGNSSDLGTVFRIDPRTGAETVVYAFSGSSDGAHPYGQLYISKGAIYGTTAAGGAANLGVVFKITP